MKQDVHVGLQHVKKIMPALTSRCHKNTNSSQEIQVILFSFLSNLTSLANVKISDF